MKKTDDELLYEILSNSELARKSNEECLAQFYFQRYGIVLPLKKDCLGFQTVFRKIRKLKQMYPKLKGSKEIQDLKTEEEGKYKDMALDHNAPIINKNNIETNERFW